MNGLQSTVLFCHVLKEELPGSECTVRSCMYHDKRNNSCRGLSVQRAQEIEDSEKRTNEIQNQFGVSEKEMKVGVRRVQEILILNSFFQFVFDKPLTEAKAKDLESVGTMSSKYESWSARLGKKPPFERIVYMSHFIKSKL